MNKDYYKLYDLLLQGFIIKCERTVFMFNSMPEDVRNKICGLKSLLKMVDGDIYENNILIPIEKDVHRFMDWCMATNLEYTFEVNI
jgi:hypothetical protein